MDKKILNTISKYRVSTYGDLNFKRVILTLFLLCCIAFGLYLGILLSPDKEEPLPSPSGKIILPIPESLTGNKIDISGYTENLAADNRFVWLAIDKKEEGLSWPLYQPIMENSSFTVRINVTGHLNAVHVSLYAMDQPTHDRISDWMTTDRSHALKKFPDHMRLHTVRFWNQKPME